MFKDITSAVSTMGNLSITALDLSLKDM